MKRAKNEKEVFIEVGDSDDWEEPVILVGETEFEGIEEAVIEVDEVEEKWEEKRKRSEKKTETRRIATLDEEKRSVSKPPAPNLRKAVVVVVIILVITGGWLWAEYRPMELVPTIDAPIYTVAGHRIQVSANQSSGRIKNYTWDFGDGTVAYGSFQTHIYTTSGTNTITLTVTGRSGATAKETSGIDVRPLSILLPEDRYGEEVVYSTKNYFSVYNPDGITTVDPPSEDLGGTIDIREVNVWMNGTTTSRLAPGRNREDGFMEEHDTKNRSSFHQLQVEGVVFTSSGTGRIDGPLRAWDSSFAELQGNHTIHTLFSSRGEFDISFSSWDESMITEDNIRAYPEPGSVSRQVSVETLQTDRSFSLGDSGVKSADDVAYSWEIRSADMISGHPCLVIRLKVDTDTMSKSNIVDFSLMFWISNASFMPLKTTMYLEQYSEGNITIAQTESVMTSLIPGTTRVQYASGVPEFLRSWEEKGDTIAGEFASVWIRVPPHDFSGELSASGDAVSQDFTIEHALALAASETGLGGYLDSRPGAYCTYSRYGKTPSVLGPSPEREWWDIVFHQPGEEGFGVNVTLTRSAIGDVTYENETYTVEPKAVASKDSITPILSFRGAQEIFKEHPSLQRAVRNNKIDVSRGSLGSDANLSLPFSASFLSPPNIDYGFSMEYSALPQGGFTETTRSVIDAERGRFVYVWIHKDNASSLPLPLMMF